MALSKSFEALSFQNEREISIKYAIKHDIMWVKSRLKDDHHDISLYWQIDIPTHSVTALEGLMDEKPFEDCPNSLRILEKIKGLEIGVGVKKKFRTRFAKEEGCTHITELSLATFDFIISRLYGPNSRDFSEEEKDKQMGMIAGFLCKNNSCTIFNQGNLEQFDSCGRYKKKDYDY